MNTSAPTQTVHPWRAALRTGGAITVSLILALAAIGPLTFEFVEDQFPGSPAAAIVAASAGFIAGLAILVNRIALLPAVSAFLTKIGLGPAPKP